MSMACERVGSVRVRLGEGPFWSSGTLRFVDLEQGDLHSIDIRDGSHQVRHVSTYASCVVPHIEGGLVCCTQSSLVYADTHTGAWTSLADFDLPGHMRLNDGKCDRAGRLWAGSMPVHCRPNQPPEGILYRCDDSCTEILHGLGISNGIAWNADDTLMYHADTSAGTLTAYPFDAEQGRLGTPGILCALIPPELGAPDGMTIDREGKLWIALWGGGGVARICPETGTMLSFVDVPARNVTSCTFGGDDLDTLYITTAMDGRGEGGEIFRCPTGTRGYEVFPAKIPLPKGRTRICEEKRH